jgi:hypothetical protein
MRDRVFWKNADYQNDDMNASCYSRRSGLPQYSLPRSVNTGGSAASSDFASKVFKGDVLR